MPHHGRTSICLANVVLLSLYNHIQYTHKVYKCARWCADVNMQMKCTLFTRTYQNTHLHVMYILYMYIIAGVNLKSLLCDVSVFNV